MNGRTIVDRYLLERELGRGGMGTVWLGTDRLVGREVAVKEIRPPRGLSDEDRETFGKRAMQEARSAASVRHPSAVTLHDIIPATGGDDAVYLIMEYLEGRDLARVVADDGPLPDARTAEIGLRILSVIEAAHALGVVHRDIKPANIMIGTDGQVTLTDFSIAHTIGDTRLTRSGTMGTSAYMAPELFETRAITPAADLWSLGATLCYAAVGKGPFDRESTAATLRAILIDDLPRPACSPGLSAAISGLLTRDPDQRATITQARQLLEAPEQAKPHTPPGREPSGYANTVTITQPAAPVVRKAAGRAPQRTPTEVVPPSPPASAPEPSPLSPPPQPSPTGGIPAWRRRLAVGVINVGVLIDIIFIALGIASGGDFQDFAAFWIVCFYPAGWIASAAWMLASRSRPQDGGLFGTALGIFVFFAAIQTRAPVYIMAMVLVAPAGAAVCCPIRPLAGTTGGLPRNARSLSARILPVLTAVGAAACYLPNWSDDHWIDRNAHRGEMSHGLALPLTIVFLYVILASVVLAARRRSLRDGVPLLAAASVALAAYVPAPLVNARFHDLPLALSFWLYAVFTAGLCVSCVWAFLLSRSEQPRNP